MRRRSLLPLAVSILAAAGFTAEAARAAEVSVTNGILTVTIENAGTEIGQFSIATGASHPHPNESVFYPVGTSWITLRDATANQMWVNGSDASAAGLAGYSLMFMNTQPAAVTPIGTSGFRTTYTLPSWTVVQDVVINGTTIADTNVRQSVTVTNTTTAPRLFGLRYFWDWEIADNDGSFFRQRSPDGAFTSTFQTFAAPGFQFFEEVDNIATPTFSIFGTVQGGTLSPAPTTPDQVRYVSWSDFDDFAWDTAVTGGNDDSGTVHFWGFNAPISLAAAASQTFTEYVSTVQGAIGQPTPVTTPGGGAGGPAAPIPTLSPWALVVLGVGLSGIAFLALRKH
ncbi:MAG: IPTL-CTERM sorting domain-containing protein [Acidobacteriota bacterium]